MRRAGPGDLGGFSGISFGPNFQENRAENLQPDCLQVPSSDQLKRHTEEGRSSEASALLHRLRLAACAADGHMGPLKGPRDPLKGPRGPLKGPQGPFKGPQGPLKGPQGPFKRPRGPF